MISVIIPAYNEEENISHSLQSLVNQKYDKNFEVIVVDNNSSDSTQKIAKKFKNKLNLKVILEKTQGRGASKARGAKEAKGQILAYLDADSRAFKNWLSTIEAAFTNDVIAITGPWRVYDLPSGFTKWFLHSFQEIVMWPIKLYLGQSYLNGMNMAFSKDAYNKTKGFDKGLNIHDDFDLARKLRKIGTIKYVPDLKVYTSGRRYKKGILAGLLSYHKGTINFLMGKRANLEDLR